MTNSLPAEPGAMLTREQALKQGALIFKSALDAVGLTEKDAAQAIGFGPKNKSKVFLMREGRMPITLSKVLQLLAHQPRAGRALLAGIASWSVARSAAVPSKPIALIDDVIRALLELAQIACAARADGKLDASETKAIAAAITRLRERLDQYEACVIKASSVRAA